MNSTSVASLARNNLGPLTTTFTRPSGCKAFAPDKSELSLPPKLWQAQTCGGDPYRDDPACWPPATAAPLKGWGFYSPGLICPADHTPACSAKGSDAPLTTSAIAPDSDPNFVFNFAPLSMEIAVGCCPVGFRCGYDGSDQTCRRSIGTEDTLVATCAGTVLTSFTSSSLPTTRIWKGAVGTASTGLLLAPMFQLSVQASDSFRYIGAAAVATGAIGVKSSRSLAAVPNATESSDPATLALKVGLREKIAVIVVPASLVAIAIGIVVAGLWRKRRRRRALTSHADATEPGVAAAHELASKGRSWQELEAGQNAVSMAEVGTEGAMHELRDGNEAPELDAARQ